MKNEIEIQFYDDDKKILAAMGEIRDDGTTILTIPTPEGWKCDHKDCVADYQHSHGTYPTLE